MIKNNYANLGKYVKDYVDHADGHIKTNFLGAGEIERLLKLQENSAIAKDVIVIEFTKEDLQDQIVNPEQLTILFSGMLVRLNKIKINEFKQSENARLAVIWTEAGYKHWVARVYWKQKDTLFVYKMNSIFGHEPKYDILFTQFLANQNTMFDVR